MFFATRARLPWWSDGRASEEAPRCGLGTAGDARAHPSRSAPVMKSNLVRRRLRDLRDPPDPVDPRRVLARGLLARLSRSPNDALELDGIGDARIDRAP